MGFIRFVLAISIVVFHYGTFWNFSFIEGKIAVETFFIISGFYMSLILNEKYINKSNSYLLFLKNRFLRLFPIYWTTLVLTCLFCVAIFFSSHGKSFPVFYLYSSIQLKPTTFLFLALANILLLGQDLVMFLGINPGTGDLFFTDNFWITRPPVHSFLIVPQAWTLGLELLFYFIAPFILRKKTIIISLLILISLMLRYYLYNYLELKFDPWTYRFFPTELAFFLFGFISYKIYLKTKQFKLPRYVYLIVLVYTTMIIMFFGYIPVLKNDAMPFSWNEIIYFAGITILIPLLFNCFKDNELDRRIGMLSYPIYICHLLVMEIIASLPFSYIKEAWCVLFFTIALSFVLNFFITSPVEKYKAKSKI